MRRNYFSIPILQQLHRWSFGRDKQIKSTLHCARDYLSMLELKFIHVSNRAPGYKQFRTKGGNCSGLNVKSMIGTNWGWQEHIDYIRAVSPYSTVTSLLQFESNQRKQRKIWTLHNLTSSLYAEIYSQDKLVLVWRMRSKEHSTYTSFVMVLWDVKKIRAGLHPRLPFVVDQLVSKFGRVKPCRFERITVIYVAPTCSHMMLLRITDT